MPTCEANVLKGGVVSTLPEEASVKGDIMPFLCICLLLNQIGVWDELQPRMNSVSHNRVMAWGTAGCSKGHSRLDSLRHWEAVSQGKLCPRLRPLPLQRLNKLYLCRQCYAGAATLASFCCPW